MNAHFISIATLPGMWERTITVGSAGKTFHATGWRVRLSPKNTKNHMPHLHGILFVFLSVYSPSPFQTGWALAPAEIIKIMHICLTQVYYSHVSIIQEAIAEGLEVELARYGQPDSYLSQTVQTLLRKRDETCSVLKEVGFTPIVPDGGYFILADTTAVGKEFDTGPGKEAYDFQFAKWMMAEKVRVERNRERTRNKRPNLIGHEQGHPHIL